MSTKNDTTWMPSKGSYPVTVGSSLAGALKANKGLPQAPKLFDRGFYSFRYNFKPESIDLYKPGTIEVKREGDRKTATIERASTVPGEGQLFTGAETAARDVDCVLVYDEELGTFTLEKLDSLINVTWGGKSTMPSNRPSESSTVTTPSASASPVKKAPDEECDLGAELDRELLSVVEDAPPKRPPKQDPPSVKASASSTPNGASGSHPPTKKPMLKREPKLKPKEPVQMFVNPNSAAAKVANRKSAQKKDPKAEQRPPAATHMTPVSKPAMLVGDSKGKGVKRGAEPETVEPTRVQKRSRLSPPPSRPQPQSKPQASKLPPPAAGLPQKPQTTLVPPQQRPQPKPQQPTKKEFNLELPTVSSSGSSSKNPLLAGGGGVTSLSLPTGSTILLGTQPTSTAAIDTLSDSESDWDEVPADGPPHQAQPQSEPQPRMLGSLTIEEDPPAGFNGQLDIVDGDEYQNGDRDGDAEGDGDGEDIDMDDLMAEMAEELQGGDGGEPEGERDLNDEMDDFLIAAVSEQDQDGYLYADEDSSSSSDDSDD